MNSIKNIIRLFNDKDLLNTSLNQGFKVLAGPILLILIPLFISSEIQGYWFSFISISALSILADLGFTVIIMQFSAHEYAFLKIEDKIIVPIDDDKVIHLVKLATLLRFSITWLGKIIAIAFPLILAIGVWFFITDTSEIEWKLPWVIYTIGAALNFINYVILSFFEGCNNISTTQRIRFYSTLMNFIIIFTLLILGLNLYALSIALFVSSTLTLLIIYSKFRYLFKQLWILSNIHTYNWFPEFWGFFKKYALSVASGFLVAQIFTPITFKYYGAIDAGKVGLTMSLSSAIFSISHVWFQSITPKINILTSQKKWFVLNKLMTERLVLTVCTYLLGFTIFGIIFILIQNSRFSEILNRVLPLIGIVIIFFYWFIQIFTYAMALYLRSHKKEPYLLLSLFGAIAIVILTFLTVNFLPVDYIFISLLITTIISFPFAFKIFKNKKTEWCI